MSLEGFTSFLFIQVRFSSNKLDAHDEKCRVGVNERFG